MIDSPNDWLWHRDQAAARLESALNAIKAGNLPQAWSDAAQAEFDLRNALNKQPAGTSQVETAQRRVPRSFGVTRAHARKEK